MNIATNEISNNQDYIDSRDLEERIKYLEAELEEGEERYTGEKEDNKEELQKLQAFKESVDNNEEWEFGITFINEDYFEEYAREFAEDIGAISKDTQWPATCIDWEQATNELQMGYTEVDFDGVPYYYR